MATLNLAVTFGGTTADEEDRRAMNWLIAEENAARVAQGRTPLPTATATERNQSYQQLMAAIVQQRHAENIRSAGDRVLFRDLKPRFDVSTDAQRTAALNALAPLPQ